MITREALEAHLAATGWEKQGDMYGKIIEAVISKNPVMREQRLCRIVLLKKSVRVDLKYRASAGFWRFGGCPLSQVVTLPNRDVLIGTFTLPAKR